MRRAYRISGRVQSVGFRWWAMREAEGLGLDGTVRNAPDGTVEVRVEGPEDAVHRFKAALHRGPSAARVDEVKREADPQEPLGPGFRTIR